MDRKDFQFFVFKHKTVKGESGTKYQLILKTGNGHKLTFKGDSSDLFEGYPIGQAISVKLGNPQITLKEARKD